MPTGWSCAEDTMPSPSAKQQDGGKRVGQCLPILSQPQGYWPELCVVSSPLLSFSLSRLCAASFPQPSGRC